MERRKLIGLIIAMPESTYATRVLEGVFRQCEKYGYDVAVFASLANVCTSYKEYRDGEVNIYNLINFDRLDGIIIDVLSLTEDSQQEVMNAVYERMQKECHVPVVSLNLPIGDYEVAKNNDSLLFRNVMEHVMDVHHCTDIYFLTGTKGTHIAEERLRVCLEFMEERGIEVGEERIFYGDFWYTGGAQLADKLISEEIPMPQAVVCASDHMALGLSNRLTENGIRIPEDLIITGFDATQEAALNEIPITSMESNSSKTAADAVDILRRKIEPGAPISPFVMDMSKGLHAGTSCGCSVDAVHSANVLYESFYFLNRDYGRKGIENKVDIGRLMDSYVSEYLTGVETPEECLYRIVSNVYHINPYKEFYLCLKEDWLDIENTITTGYPETMRNAIVVKSGQGSFHSENKGERFATEIMLPQMFEEHENPQVFYFGPVHFKQKVFGYAVLVRELQEKCKINLVYRNWLRNVNVALEMIQAKNRLLMLSMHDGMTGAYNRRGMDIKLMEMLAEAKEDDKLLVAIVDMDGLKYINDNFGHVEGDYGIQVIHEVAKNALRSNEICVRAGGDEFYIIGVGEYRADEVDERMKALAQELETANQKVAKEYPISASIGYVLEPASKGLQVERVIDAADVEMYKNKIARKKQRF